MKHDRLRPIIEAICMANDYDGYDIQIKTDQIMSLLHPINPTMDNVHSEVALYGILHIVLDLVKEYECTSVNNAVKSSNQQQDLNDTSLIVNNKNQK